jgi:hypothetical protein
MPTDKRAKTFRLSALAWALLGALSTHHGVPMAAIMEMGIRRMTRQDVPQAAERIEAGAAEKGRERRDVIGWAGATQRLALR